jgi:hypothetical protein
VYEYKFKPPSQQNAKIVRNNPEVQLHALYKRNLIF